MKLDDFLARVRVEVDSNAPHLRPLFDSMAGEARFARAWLDAELTNMRPGSAVLEVGGGVFLLACQLAREGFAVTAIEPTGVGFGAFEELGSKVLALAGRDGVIPSVARCRVEEFKSDLRYALAYSVNVMEHVDAPGLAIARVSAVLSPGGRYRFLCPNYLFPYEPHFNIPTFGSKGLTEKLMRRRIEGNSSMDDPGGVWKSLNWITVPQVKRMAGAVESLDVGFDTGTFAWILERALSDAEFAKRRSSWMVAVIRILSALRLSRLASLMPPTCQPVMDVSLTKRH